MATHALRPGSRRASKRRISFDEHLPVDHRLSTFYRIGAGLMGPVLLAFGILGLVNKVGRAARATVVGGAGRPLIWASCLATSTAAGPAATPSN